MSSVNARVYGGQTAGERVHARRTALLDATFELLADDGWRALRIETICRHAGLNKRYFYESFDSLDAAVGGSIKRLTDETIERTLAAVDASLPQHEYLHAALATLIGYLTEDPRRARVLFGAVAAGEEVAAHRAEAVRRVVAVAANQGRTLNQLADEPRVHVIASMLIGGTGQVLLDWLDGAIATSREQLVTQVTELWLALSAVSRD